MQGLQLLPSLGFGHALAQASQQQAYASMLREGKIAKTYTVAIIEEPQSTDSAPEGVGYLRHQN
jgi:hypothetical protein